MPKKSFKKRFLELSLGHKLVAIGASIGILSVFFPWYRDVDKFDAGYSFLGITGPLYAIGATLLLGFGVSLAMVSAKMMKKKIFDFPFKESTYNAALGAGSFYLVFLAYSIYFHHQFGLHIVNKEPRIGFLFAFLASLVVGYGGYTLLKEEKPKKVHIKADEHMRVEKSLPVREHAGIVKDVKEKVESHLEKSFNSEPEKVDVGEIQIKSEIWNSTNNHDER